MPLSCARAAARCGPSVRARELCFRSWPVALIGWTLARRGTGFLGQALGSVLHGGTSNGGRVTGGGLVPVAPAVPENVRSRRFSRVASDVDGDIWGQRRDQPGKGTASRR